MSSGVGVLRALYPFFAARGTRRSGGACGRPVERMRRRGAPVRLHVATSRNGDDLHIDPSSASHFERLVALLGHRRSLWLSDAAREPRATHPRLGFRGGPGVQRHTVSSGLHALSGRPAFHDALQCPPRASTARSPNSAANRATSSASRGPSHRRALAAPGRAPRRPTLRLRPLLPRPRPPASSGCLRSHAVPPRPRPVTHALGSGAAASAAAPAPCGPATAVAT
jgi:hypothetical protein